MDWRVRRDNLVRRYLEKSNGDIRRAIAELDVDKNSLPLPAEKLLLFLEAKTELQNMLDRAELSPGDPENCHGNGRHGIEMQCENCDYFLDCFSAERE